MRDGDAEAFERFCRSEYGAVVRTAWLITGDREAAVDLAQEAFARAFERGHRSPSWTGRAPGRPNGAFGGADRDLSILPTLVTDDGLLLVSPFWNAFDQAAEAWPPGTEP